MLLICGCGQKLNTPGATPGRVGKCPRCGSLLKVDTVAPTETTGANLPPRAEALARPTYHRPPRARRSAPPRQVWADGLVAHPTLAERSILQSMLYPLRNASGLALLTFVPPLLWVGLVPLFLLIPMAVSGSAVTLLALILQLPLLILLLFAFGHTLLFLGDVVITSCLGEVALPRQASWNPAEIWAGGMLWVWGLLVGGVVGGWPAVWYWLRCGDVDWFDQVVLIELILPGVGYAQMALVLALTENSPWSAGNPTRVVGAIWRGGWSYFWPCLVTGSLLAFASWMFKVCLETGNEVVSAVAFWFWWVSALYLAMVALRWLGLFCYRTRAVVVAPRRRRHG